MANQFSFLDTVDNIISDGVKKGILHLYTGDRAFTGNLLEMNGKEVINFGSCSYLGLEFNDKLKAGAVDAITKFGTQFSSSRAYVSTGQYAVLENLFEQLFDGHVIVAPTTSLAHIAVIPVIVGCRDAVIIDHQVHSSVQTAVALLKPKGITVEMIRHNRMDILEEKIIALKKNHEKIWYMADGIYSMYGDAAPLDELQMLLDRYPEFNLYVDDAHGMSCFGKHGRGYVLSKMKLHPRMIVATSLAKAFATGGSAVIFPDKETARKVRTCGGPLITSGPLQPATLGAAIASAGIHLSDEITQMQEELQQNILYTNLQIRKYGLPVVAQTPSPVFFIGVSLPKIAYRILQQMMEKGFYLNIGTFPAVPMKNSGIRFTITRLHTFAQIELMIENLSLALNTALKEENFSMEGIYNAFKMQNSVGSREVTLAVASKASRSSVGSLQLAVNSQQPPVGSRQLEILTHYNSITEINEEEWNTVFGNKGSFDYNGLRILEETFSKGIQPENKWEFDYLLVKKNEKIIAATFFTTTIMKDDMLAPSEISEQVEEIRKLSGPYYKTSRVLMMGSMLTEGEHLFIDKTDPDWPGVTALLLDKINELQEKNNAEIAILRDIAFHDEKLGEMMQENGYFKTKMPDKYVATGIPVFSQPAFMNTLSPNSKKNFKKEILKFENSYSMEIIKNPDEVFISKCISLYRNVKMRSLELNTFTLPDEFFRNAANDSSWEILVTRSKENCDESGNEKVVSVIFSHTGEDTYNPMVIGIDYEAVCSGSPYRQSLYNVIKRASFLGKATINLGFSAGAEKKKIGGRAIEFAAYVYASDNYIFESLGSYTITKKHMSVKR